MSLTYNQSFKGVFWVSNTTGKYIPNLVSNSRTQDSFQGVFSTILNFTWGHRKQSSPSPASGTMEG